MDNAEARRRVLNLYKAWYRQIPYIGNFTIDFVISLTFLLNLIHDFGDIDIAAYIKSVCTSVWMAEK